jgi:hypothetical protein
MENPLRGARHRPAGAAPARAVLGIRFAIASASGQHRNIVCSRNATGAQPLRKAFAEFAQPLVKVSETRPPVPWKP